MNGTATTDVAATVAEQAAAFSADAAASRNEAAIVKITSLGHFLCHLGELVFTGVLTAVMVEFGLEPHVATALGLLGYVLMGLGAIPVGFLSDRFGPRFMLQIYFIAMAAAGVLVAIAPNVYFLFIGLTALGLAASIYHPAGIAMISLGVRAKGRAMGINGVAGSLGVSFGPLIGQLATSVGMWRLGYVLVAILGAVAAIWLRWAAPATLPTHGHHAPPPTKPERRPWTAYLPLAALFVIMMLGGWNYRMLVTALPTYLSGETAAGGELAKKSTLTFIALLLGGVGQYFGGWAGDRFGHKRVYVSLMFCLATVATVLGLVGGTPAAVVVACLVSICLFGQQPVENTILGNVTSTTRRSLSYGTKFALTFGIGAMGSQVVGLIWHTQGELGPVFFLISCSALVMATLFLLLGRRVTKPE